MKQHFWTVKPTEAKPQGMFVVLDVDRIEAVEQTSEHVFRIVMFSGTVWKVFATPEEFIKWKGKS